MAPDRERVATALSDAGIQTSIHYPLAVPDTEAFAEAGESCPVARRRADLQLSLPMHPHLSEDDVRAIAGAVTDALVAQAA